MSRIQEMLCSCHLRAAARAAQLLDRIPGRPAERFHLHDVAAALVGDSTIVIVVTDRRGKVTWQLLPRFCR